MTTSHHTTNKAARFPQTALPFSQTNRVLKLDHRLQCRRCLEAHRLASFDLDRLASTRVFALARLGLLHSEGTEAGQSELPLFLHGHHDRLDHVGGNSIGCDARNL